MSPESAGTPVAPASKVSPKRSRWRRALAIGIALAVVVATFVFVLPKIANYGDVWDAIKDLSSKDERITKALRWKQVAAPLSLIGAPGPADLEACRELAATVAVGL